MCFWVPGCWERVVVIMAVATTTRDTAVDGMVACEDARNYETRKGWRR